MSSDIKLAIKHNSADPIKHNSADPYRLCINYILGLDIREVRRPAKGTG